MDNTMIKIWGDLIDKYLSRMPVKDRIERVAALEKAVDIAKKRLPPA